MRRVTAAELAPVEVRALALGVARTFGTLPDDARLTVRDRRILELRAELGRTVRDAR